MDIHVHHRVVGSNRVDLGVFARAICAGLAALAVLAAWREAHALTVEITQNDPSLVGEVHEFAATTDATGTVTFEWQFGEEAPAPGGDTQGHTFVEPGLHNVTVRATDEAGDSASAFVQHLVHYPLTERRPSSASSIVYDEARNRVYAVNQDNDSVTAIDPDGLVALAELPVYRKPESLALSPTGLLWVVHQDDYAVAVVNPDTFVIDGGFRLPYASQPVAIAMSPTGDAAYITLMALGKLLKLDPVTGIILGEADVGPRPRGIAVSHDGRDVYVTRFISKDEGGELVKVDAAAMTTASRILLRLDAETEDSDLQARGLPNYLFAVGITPDGRQAWIPGKKDNTVRGLLRDGQDLTHDTTVRPLVAIVDTAAGAEMYERRVDLDDRSLPVHVTFSPYGNLAILTLAGSNRVEVRDVNKPVDNPFSAIGDVGAFPRATVLTPNGQLFVQGGLSRNVLVYDLSRMLESFDTGTPPLLADIPTVANEKLAPDVLLGKKLFHDSEDTRLAFEGYISCGVCHFEGIDDGRVYDFSTRGEGFRNTLSLLGTRVGLMNWTGNLDEIQDFEHQIRDLFGGTGFIPDDVLASGTLSEPLGDPKAGLSPELDALAAYVASLDRVNPSPYRNQDGTLTADGVLGKALYQKLGCDFCHGGPAFSDSAGGRLHDVGTIGPMSGTRAGELLLGFDTPTLRGVWETPPYLHDGSAPTLRDVLTTKNPTGLHGFVSALAPVELDQLVSYLLQIDDEAPIRPLPFDPPAPPPSSMPEPAPTMDAEVEPSTDTGHDETSGKGVGNSGCTMTGTGTRAARGSLLGLLAAALLLGRRRRCRPWASSLAVLLLCASGCGSDPATEGDSESEPKDWSELPAATPDPELARLGVRQETYDRLCARGRGDSFATELCGAGTRPDIPDFSALLELTGLSESRAFALTGNSTSLVARSVSAINPRIIVFPRVEADLARPETMTAIGFVRGEQFVEIVSRDLVTDDFNFYLVAFEQPCNYEATGCDLASLLTEEIEHDWTAFSVYDQDDLEATSFDCRSCHRAGPPGTRHLLRMQELTSPWLHWFPQRFIQQTDSDRVLLAHFSEAHGSETQYGGIPIETIKNALDEGSGGQLEALVRAEGFAEQPNEFDARIAAEAAAGTSPTWEARFSAHQSGQAIAVPYPGVDVTDVEKRTAAVRSYLDVVTGAAPRETLLDIREIFSADAEQKLSFVPTPGTDGRTVLLQMCSRCHDGRGNPELAKNRFDVLRLDEMSRAQKEQAILRLSATDDTRMPPWRVGTLTPEGIQAATLELQK